MRKDLRGVGNAIDTFATTILIRNKANALIEKHKEILKKSKVKIDTKPIADDPTHNQRIQAIIAGSIRAPGRLYQVGIAETRACKYCDEDNATLIHIAWQCPEWQDIRGPYFHATVEYVNKIREAGDSARENYLMDLLTTHCVLHLRSYPRS